MTKANNFRNADGTYDGGKFLSSLTGISEPEIKWIAKRMGQLIREEGKTKEEARAIVKMECKEKPWEATDGK